MKKNLATTETTDNSILSIISSAASNPDVDVSKMQILLDMQERIIDKDAQAAFNASFVDLQAKGLRVIKRAENKQTNSNYAKLDTIQDALVPLLGEFGFAITFGTEESPLDNHTRVVADLIHRLGHSKHYFYDAPFDMAGIKGSVNKTATHGKASGVSYGQRYLTGLIFNITYVDDDDGNAANSIPRITTDQATQLRDLIKETDSSLDGFCRRFKIESVDELAEQAFTMALDMLQRKQQAQK